MLTDTVIQSFMAGWCKKNQFSFTGKSSLMKHAIVIFSSFLLIYPAFGQDTTQVIYSQEIDSLPKQRFMDRYENVFMTKVPTRHMFKTGLSQYYQTVPFALYNDNVLSNTSLNLGYEYKFAPAFSVAVSSQLPFLGYGVPLKFTWINTAFDAQIRWFFDMRRRIRSGKSANNFSGNYLAVNYTYPGSIGNSPTAGFKLGFQRRFLNNGFLDFAVAFQQLSPIFKYGPLQNWSFSSQASFGLAFGDWKSSSVPPLCDVLLCNKHISQQWKILIPDLTFGSYLNRIRLGFGYERKLGESPVSLNIQYDISLLSGSPFLEIKEKDSFRFLNSYYSYTTAKEILQTITFQPRYYFLQNRQKLNGNGGNGLSGVYIGIHSELSLYNGRHYIRYPGSTANLSRISRNTVRAGLLAGYQQRVFSHGFLDLNTSYNFERNLNTLKNTSGLRANLGIGFAF